MDNNKPIHLLLVEDNKAHAELIWRTFETQADWIHLTVVHTLREASASIEQAPPNAIIADLRLPDGQGIELLAANKTDLSYPVIIMTSYGDEQVAVEAMKAGALDYVVKSETTIADMPHIVERALREWEHIIERNRAENALRESEARYALAARGANDGLWDWDLNTNIIYYSPRWKSMLGCYEDDVGDTPAEWFQRVHAEDREQLEVKIALHLEGNSPHFESEYRILRQDDAYRWMLCRGVAVRDANGKPTRMAGSQTDISDRKLAEEQLFYAASHDSLTNLTNRALFLDHLEQAAERAKRYKNYLFALLFLDLDHFKVVNDGLGHHAGDQLLVEFSRRLEACIRPIDTIARLGGDEFAILIEHINGVIDATTVAERIKQFLSAPFQLDGHEIFMSASIGVTLSSTGYEHAGDALRDADTAMYRAKTNGRARYELFDHSMHTNAVERLRLEADLRRAIEHQELLPYYQPIIALPGGRIIGAEVLLRWQHPQRGLLSPLDFIPLAEETGLIVPISAWLIRMACTQSKIWQDAGHAPFNLAINLSARDFKYDSLPQRIREILTETNVPAHTIELEITETIAMDNLDSIIDILKELHQIGVKISIDDFGTGHSSLGRLKHLPINTLKIDRSFIRDMIANPDDAALTKAIIAMARSLNLQVIAEGVETSEQFMFLQEQRCDRLQGFFFSRPIPTDEFTKFLQEKQYAFQASA